MSARILIAVVWTMSSAELGDGQDMVILTQYETIMIPVFCILSQTMTLALSEWGANIWEKQNLPISWILC